MKIKRIAAPRTWPIKRKQGTWITFPKSSFKKEECLPLTLVLKDLIGLCASSREVKKLVSLGKVFVNSRRVKKPEIGVGLFDVISVTGVKTSWRIVYDSTQKLSLITCSDGDKKVVRVIGKTVLSKTSLQLNLTGGVNVVSSKKTINVGDSLLVSLPDFKILEHFKPVKGSLAYIVGGSHKGELATVLGVKDFKGVQENMFSLKSGKNEFQTPKSNVFIMGKTKEAVKVL
jgi:small subunit ribosomal protein S4e